MTERKRKLEVYESNPSNGVASAVPSSGNGTVNLYTGRPYSQRYYDILAKRKGEFAATASPRVPRHRPSFLHASMRKCSVRVAPCLSCHPCVRSSTLSCTPQGCRYGRRGRTLWP